VVGLNLAGAFVLGLILLALHLLSVTLTRALRTYSPSRLEERCRRSGRPGRADEVGQSEERTERATEMLAVLTGLALAALLGVAVGRHVDANEPYLPFESVLAIALGISAAGYVLAGVLGRVFPEPVIDIVWPAARWVRLTAGWLACAMRQFERLVEYLATPRGAEPRPASVEVEIPPDADHPEDDEPDIPDSTRTLLQRAVEMTRRDVVELMTPRSRMVMLPSTVTARAAMRAINDTGKSRVPLYGENHDDIVGVLYAKDLFAEITEAPSAEGVVPSKLARPVHFVPETKNAHDLLQEMRGRRTQLAIVLDEFGAITGLVTLEDLVEELVGPIDDEHDEPTPADPVVSLGGTRYEVDAALSLDDLNERMDLRLPTDGDFQTVGGLAFHSLGRVPEPGATFRVEGIEFQILEIADHSIRRVRIDLQPAALASRQ
jgi:CBS domain containing-hemolysin-like protein